MNMTLCADPPLHTSSPARALFTLVGCAAALLSFPAQAAGFDARAQANASVYTLPGFESLSPWPSGVTDGYETLGANGRRSAAAVNPGGTLSGKTVSSASYADLSTGKLGVAGHVTNALATPDIGSFAAVITSFADSFRFGSGTGSGPFVWSGDSVRFGIALDGNSTNTTSRRFSDWSLFINVYSAGTFDRPQPEWSARELGGAQWGGNRLPDGRSTTSVTTGATGPIGILAAFTGALDTADLLLSAHFSPGADFDWSMTLLSFPGGLSTELGTQSSDFLHTATVSFAGPNGAVVRSGSGVFPATAALGEPAPGTLPEPGSWALVALGLGVLLAAPRGCRQQTGGRSQAFAAAP